MHTRLRLTPWVLASFLLLGVPGLVSAAGQAVPRDGYPPYGRDYPPYGRDGRYPDRGERARGGWWGYRDVAFNNGFEDGYRRGLDDGRDRDRFDPTREKDYRKGDKGYSRRYGNKDDYKYEYRQGFRSGYERGYREGRYYDRDSRRRGGYGRWPW